MFTGWSTMFPRDLDLANESAHSIQKRTSYIAIDIVIKVNFYTKQNERGDWLILRYVPLIKSKCIPTIFCNLKYVVEAIATTDFISIKVINT